MKKLAALAMIFILLFNIAGYSVLYWMAARQATQEFSARLDNDQYPGSQAITIKIPVSLPYQPDRDYERAHGNFEYNGQHYKLVKRRVLNDTLYVVCVVDETTTRLAHEMNAFTKKTNDSSSRALKVVGSNPVQDYSNGAETTLIPVTPGWSYKIIFPDHGTFLRTAFIEKNSPPPWS